MWPLPIRLAHWILAAFVIVNQLNETGQLHRWIGYAALVVIAYRVGYGFISKRTLARLSLPHVTAAMQHIIQIRHGGTAMHNGHNPLGWWGIYTIWMLIIGLGITGWISQTDALWGEDWPISLHQVFANALWIVIVLHVLAVGLMSRLEKKSLLKPMLWARNHDNN